MAVPIPSEPSPLRPSSRSFGTAASEAGNGAHNVNKRDEDGARVWSRWLQGRAPGEALLRGQAARAPRRRATRIVAPLAAVLLGAVAALNHRR